MKLYFVRMKSYFQNAFAWPDKIEWFETEREAVEYAKHNEYLFDAIYLEEREKGRTINTVCIYDKRNRR